MIFLSLIYSLYLTERISKMMTNSENSTDQYWYEATQNIGVHEFCHFIVIVFNVYMTEKIKKMIRIGKIQKLNIDAELQRFPVQRHFDISYP